MKYNPRVNEDAARIPGFLYTHPLQDTNTVQGSLALMHELQEWLKEIGGFAGVSLQPAAGAHGELSGILMIRAYHLARGDKGRRKILIPDSAHGTNPASTTMSGLELIELPSDERGNVDVKVLRSACSENVAGLMITNPNTLGLFEEHIEEVVDIVHDCGGLIYGDGANMNALTGTLVRAYAYIRAHGGDGLRGNAEHAVLNANYLLSKVRDAYHLPFERTCLHEFVIEGRWRDVPDVHALDISKRLMDYGFHPPTNYFPLIVKEALMIEPTETESRETLDAFADALLEIAAAAHNNPDELRTAPQTTPVGRIDEVRAARNLVLCCHTQYPSNPDPSADPES